MKHTTLAALALAIALTSCSSSSSGTGTGRPVAQADPGDISDAQFATVQKVLAENGARMERVRPNAVHVYPPVSAVSSMTQLQAETMAATIKSRLGANATVYIKGPGGNTIGSYR